MATRLFKVGFATTDTPGDIQYLSAHASSGNYDSFQHDGSALQVASGQALYIGHIVIRNANGQNDIRIDFSHSTSPVNDGGTPSGNTPMGKGGGAGPYAGINQNGGSYLTNYDVLMVVPQNEYFNLFNTDSSAYTTCAALGLMF